MTWQQGEGDTELTDGWTAGWGGGEGVGGEGGGVMSVLWLKGLRFGVQGSKVRGADRQTGRWLGGWLGGRWLGGSVLGLKGP